MGIWLHRSVGAQIAMWATVCASLLGWQWWGATDFVSLWLTNDQRGRLAFEDKEFAKAAERFDDPGWSGVAYYAAGQYEDAAAQFARGGDAIAAFNRGNALLKNRDYDLAIGAYDRALELDQELQIAAKNRQLTAYIIEYLEDLREASDPGDQPDLGADDFKFDNQRNRGQEVAITNVTRLEAKSTEQWMRSVDTRMSDYLRTRFLVESATSEDR